MSSNVLKRDCPQGDRIMASELFTDIAGRVRENSLVGISKIVDGDGIFVAVYIPKSPMKDSDLQTAMESISLARPCSPQLSPPESKAITQADEEALEAEDQGDTSDPVDSDSPALP